MHHALIVQHAISVPQDLLKKLIINVENASITVKLVLKEPREPASAVSPASIKMEFNAKNATRNVLNAIRSLRTAPCVSLDRQQLV